MKKLLNLRLWRNLTIICTIIYGILMVLMVNHPMAYSWPWYIIIAPGFVVLIMFLLSIIDDMITGGR